MNKTLKIQSGQATSAGIKAINQDFHGLMQADGYLLESKGIACAIADGISSSDVSQIASETAVKNFLADYYSTADTWSVKKSAFKVLQASNAWLYSQSQNSPNRFNKDKGYICTFSALVIKSNTAHTFHSGDSRIYRLANNKLEQITPDHRRVISQDTIYLTRALGVHPQLDLDYQTLPIQLGDIFILATDGIYEWIEAHDICSIIKSNQTDLNQAAQLILDHALNAGSLDNLTLQIINIVELPDQQLNEVKQHVRSLPLPDKLEARKEFDGYRIIRNIYISSRSHVYLAQDLQSMQQVIIKTPSTELQNNQDYLERFLIEDWIAKRLNNPHVLKAFEAPRKKSFLYNVTEYIEGQSLSQWMIDHPKPDIDTVRKIILQVVKGLQAFHRQEMLHQDLRPNNIMIDATGTAKIIDFGAIQVAGLTDMQPEQTHQSILGTAQFTAPEYYLGHKADARADIFSLGVICYQMLSGNLPYGNGISRIQTPADLRKLHYHSLCISQPHIPQWIDDTIKKAVSLEPKKRYYEVSEFSFDLQQPSREFIHKTRPPLIERDPVMFWQGLCGILLLIIVLQAMNMI